MLKIKITLSFAALLCGLLIIFAAPKQVSAQFLPPGSYSNTCKDMKAIGATLLAKCKGKGTGYDFSSTDSLDDFFECDGDISNNDSKLNCSRNTNSALMQKAKAAIDEALRTVYGTPGNYQADYPVYKFYLQDMFKQGYAESFYLGSLGKLLNTKTARIYFLDKFNSPSGASVKAKNIDLAFKEVYATGVSPKDLAVYMGQRTGYTEVIQAETKKLNADKVLRRLAISYAYKKTMGRTSTPAETDYWMARTEYYQQIVDANRAFLYAPNGAKDLTETIKRHLLDKGIDKPSIEQINAKIVKFSQYKAIYDEMN